MKKRMKLARILFVVLTSSALIVKSEVALGGSVQSEQTKTGIGFTGEEPTPPASSSDEPNRPTTNSETKETTTSQSSSGLTSETNGTTANSDNTEDSTKVTNSTETATTFTNPETTLEEGVGNNGIRDQKDSTNGQSGSVLGKILPATGEKTHRVLLGLGVLILSMCAVYLWSKKKRGDSR